MNTCSARILFNISGFPLGEPGAYSIKLYVRKKDGNEQWKECARFPLLVEFNEA